MRILIANDDGYLAPGVAALVEACEGLGDLDIVAPEQNASGTSNSLTLNRGLSVYEAVNGFRYINGTPSDCVHLALSGLLEQRPDLVVSGINQGANMGDDTLYSGTVAAAMEGFLFGIPAIAFSQVQKGWDELDAAARVARSVIEHVLRDPPASSHYLLNVNIPNRADADTRPRRIRADPHPSAASRRCGARRRRPARTGGRPRPRLGRRARAHGRAPARRRRRAPTRSRRVRCGAAPSFRRPGAGNAGVRRHQPADRSRSDDLEAVGRRPHARAALRRRARARGG